MQDVKSLTANIRAENEAAVTAALRGITQLTDLTPHQWLDVLEAAEERIENSMLFKGTPKAIFKQLLQKIADFATPGTGLGLEDRTLSFCMESIKKHKLTDCLREIKNNEGFCLLYFFLNSVVRSWAQEISGQKHLTELVQAVERRDIPTVEALIKQGANLNFNASKEKPLLFIALQGSNPSLALARALILHGARTTDTSSCGLLEYVEAVIRECGEFNDYAFLESCKTHQKNRLFLSILNYLHDNKFKRVEIFSPLIVYLLSKGVDIREYESNFLVVVTAKRIESGDFSVLNGIVANNSSHLFEMVRSALSKLVASDNPAAASLFTVIKSIVERISVVNRSLNESLLEILFDYCMNTGVPRRVGAELECELVKLFIANGADVATGGRYRGFEGEERSALVRAFKCNASSRIVRCLLKSGAPIENGIPTREVLAILVPQKYHLYIKLKSFDERNPEQQLMILRGLQEIMRRPESSAEEKDRAVIQLLEENGLYKKARLVMLMQRRRGTLFSSCVPKGVAKMIAEYGDSSNPVTPAVSVAVPQKNLRS